MITRRDLLLRSAAAAALAGLPRELFGEGAGDPVADAFRAALAREPWLLAFATATRESFGGAAELALGQLPAGLAGTLYRNGPAGHEVGARRYQHWFDGDGLVQAFRIGDGRVEHRARFVTTKKRALEARAGRPIVSGFGTSWPDVPAAGSTAEGNAANISVLAHAGRLLALWEAADAYALDPATLETLGPHPWSPETVGVPFSAHPRLEPDGTLWNFGSVPWAGMLVLYRISPAGALAGVWTIPIERPAYVHDFVVTERHAVFVMPPLHYDASAEATNFLERHRWDANAPTRILVVDKADPAKRRWLEMPACFAFHFGNGWEEADGTIRLDAFRYDDASILYREQRDVMWGRWGRRRAWSAPVLITLHPARGTVREERADGNGEFPRVDPRRIGRRYRYVYSLAQRGDGSGGHPLFDAIERRDLETGTLQGWRYPGGVLPEEHVFVPRSGTAPEGVGWLVGSSLDFERGVSQLCIFDAEAIDAGPLAVARLGYALPLGLHGWFAPNAPRLA
jgi:carotenoid cleavage dioxygenase